MGKSIKCDHCSKPATVHLTQIVNNQIHKVDLCEDCAAAKGVTDPSGFSLADLLLKGGEGAAAATAVAGLVCTQCGFTQSDFKKTGRLGCPSCYEHFQPLLKPILANMHKGDSHTGKVPHLSLKRRSYSERLAHLQQELDKAIQGERYEDAAGFRDEILTVKRSMEEES
ncbi:MAG: excinuclease ABC subunit B [Puniceicoccaceae bacterium]|nr:MAG: excinuclease ABC subunit B [Puniceicoccaceae bacterium]